MEDIFATIVASEAGITAEHPLAGVLASRRNIIELTQSSFDAALRPDPPGGLTHAERAALSCRIAQLNADESLACHFEDMIQFRDDTSALSGITDTSRQGGEDVRLRAIIRHTDLVATSPKEATEGDIDALRSAGLVEAEIVQLSELIAFVSYLVRVLAGLRLMGGVV